MALKDAELIVTTASHFEPVGLAAGGMCHSTPVSKKSFCELGVFHKQARCLVLFMNLLFNHKTLLIVLLSAPFYERRRLRHRVAE